MPSYRPSQTLHPLSLLAQVSSRQVTGCLSVITADTTWQIFLDQGRLNYATSSGQAFDRLDAQLRKLSNQVPQLVSALRVQVRLLFEKTDADTPEPFPDYQAICWLVEQQHLHPNQAATLIEAIAKEVLEDFLQLREGHYELIESDMMQGFPKLCQLKLRPLVETCYERVKQQQTVGRPSQTTRGWKPQSNGQLTVPPPQGPVPSQALNTEPMPISGPPTAKDTRIPKKTTYTIACIDDSPTVLRAIHNFLDDKLFSVLMISDPVKALMQIVRNKPDLILLDVTMPNLDGYELCSLLRRHPEFKNIPIIMVTSNTGFIDRAKAKLVRASGYLTKPFNQSDLLKIIFKHLN